MLDHVDEFDQLLTELHDCGALKHIVLIGSWTVHVYQSKYPKIQSEMLTTHDVDFSVHRAFAEDKISSPSIGTVLQNLGYTSRPKGGPPEGQIFIPDLQHQHQLDVEFLCAHGRNIKAPYLIKGLGVIATPLKYQDFLLDNTEVIDYKRLTINVPQPVYYAAHKISISQTRCDGGKAEKDLLCALNVMKETGEKPVLKIGRDGKSSFYRNFKKGWDALEKIKN